MEIQCQGIEDAEGIADAPVSMTMTVFDNSLGAAGKVTVSDGEIHVRGATTREYPKKSYKLSLVQESTGGHIRANDISLLGMRQDDDWILYAAYNDQEKVRNVFCSNLWQDTCAEDNAYRINTGVEYQYVELLINGEYRGLYALGYSIDKKQMQVDEKSGKEALYKITAWTDSSLRTITRGNAYEIRGMTEQEENRSLLTDYYNKLLFRPKENEELYAGIDLDNAIDICLFFNLIQGVDNVSDHLVKNLFLAVREEQGRGLTVLYCPWDMDISWGNDWQGQAVNFTVPYGISPDRNCIMESGYLEQLLLNNDAYVWKKFFDRYHYLRSNLWTEEKMNLLLDVYEADIYGSGAYLRDMERWPDGSYADPSKGLSVFREYVSNRLKEADAYYERLENCYNESIFIRRSTQYKNFREHRFFIELNDRELLNDRDFIEFFTFLGVDVDLVTEDIRYIIVDSGGTCDYRSSLAGEEASEETGAGRLSYISPREGIYQVFLDGIYCCDVSNFSKPRIKMSIIKENSVEAFSFVKDYAELSQSNILSELAVYIKALSVTDYAALVEINDPVLLQDPACLELFAPLGIAQQEIRETTDFIVWNGNQKTCDVLDDFHSTGGRRNTSVGVLELSEDEWGTYYRLNLNSKELLTSTYEERKSRDIRILLLDAKTNEIVEGVWWMR